MRTEKGHLILASALVERCLKRFHLEGEVVATTTGAKLERCDLQHPFYPRSSLLITGTHVTAEDGTGLVHTAPAYGVDDFLVLKRYTTEVLNPVQADGRFAEDLPLFGGQRISEANPKIVELLRAQGSLLAGFDLPHSVAHCWRHKSPTIFRATPQWFISMQQAGLREDANAAIKQVRWIPDWGQERIAGMINNRPDWCISRQRTWGVPIAIFIDKVNQTPHPRTVELMRQVAERIEAGGVDAWFELDAKELLGAEADQYDKVTDILDVWFDSGVSHACVLDAREAELGGAPADLYLEGSDQHRGWFQSSLLTGVAMRGSAPYRQVLTHGFAVDQYGKKMSKSAGNVVAPQSVMSNLGADVWRLWVAATDYRAEMSVSDEILKRVSESYRRIRNTCRYLLANIDGFVPAEHGVAYEQLLPIDQWVLDQAAKLQAQVEQAYLDYEFHQIYQLVHEFCSIKLGSFYLDVLKDRMYTMRSDAPARRSAQTAMHHILQAVARWIAPILSFTAEEIWAFLPGEKPPSVLYTTWYSQLRELDAGAALNATDFAHLLELREAVNKALEPLRKSKTLGSGLEADVTVYLPAELRHRWHACSGELRFLLIVSSVDVRDLANAPADWLRSTASFGSYAISIAVSEHAKCVRCWQHRVDVGVVAEHPEICVRCAENVAGPGEVRAFF